MLSSRYNVHSGEWGNGEVRSGTTKLVRKKAEQNLPKRECSIIMVPTDSGVGRLDLALE